MTKQTPITPFGAHKVPHDTAASRAFPALLTLVTDFIIAERDLEDVGHSQDPAYVLWLRDADRAQTRLMKGLRHFHALPNVALADQPLFRTARLIEAMLGSEELGGARRLHREMHFSFFSQFQLPGIGVTAMQRNAMLIQARHLMTALAALPLFDSAPEVLDDTRGSDEPPAPAF
ncbi:MULTISPECIES: hypothetical protein [Pacificibacter]|uniref:hypothetical protein n=1 Tax=Pacificibacter TaxID=1042323 RepID=UPI001C0A1FD9|nr:MULTISPECIES: hypothetical protein [Pacificibacter]MBU2935170.1 hypothetical protein [Pacificibacter marinus]MDO6615962.1 hypothetical protein [Pacificibacter sp. 1_MG-2023]